MVHTSPSDPHEMDSTATATAGVPTAAAVAAPAAPAAPDAAAVPAPSVAVAADAAQPGDKHAGPTDTAVEETQPKRKKRRGFSNPEPGAATAVVAGAPILQTAPLGECGCIVVVIDSFDLILCLFTLPTLSLAHSLTCHTRPRLLRSSLCTTHSVLVSHTPASVQRLSRS